MANYSKTWDANGRVLYVGAPIFGIADYGLVADLHQAIPEMTAKL